MGADDGTVAGRLLHATAGAALGAAIALAAGWWLDAIDPVLVGLAAVVGAALGLFAGRRAVTWLADLLGWL